MILIEKCLFMKKTLRGMKNNSNEFWFNWLIKAINSYEPFHDFEHGQSPQFVAEKFFSINRNQILKKLKDFDADDINILEQFQKLSECEWHVYRMLKNQLELKNNVKYINFRRNK